MLQQSDFRRDIMKGSMHAQRHKIVTWVQLLVDLSKGLLPISESETEEDEEGKLADNEEYEETDGDDDLEEHDF